MEEMNENEKKMEEEKQNEKETQTTKGGLRTMPFIFANELSEKLAVVGFGANMVSYLTQQLHMPITKAANTLTNFGGTASLTPLLGAFIADAFAGRFWTITVASIIYQIGMISLTVSAVLPRLRPPPCTGNMVCEEATSSQLAVLYASLLLTAIGSGGIRPCVVAFGAEQFDETNPKEKTRIYNFFNWYYFGMGVSILAAVTVIVYIQENIGWGWGLGIPAVAMAISIIAFVAGFPLYRHFEPCGSPFTRLVQVIVAAFRKRKLSIEDPSLLYENEELDASISPSGLLLHTNHLKFFDKAAIVTEEDRVKWTSSKDKPLNLWKLCTVHRVEELKSVIRMGPIWASGILLITAYSQQGTFSLQQARTMDRRLINSFEIPPGSMSVFTIVSMLTTVTIYDRILIPIARRFTGLDRGISFLHRMGVGFAISVFATLVAGFVEGKRKHAAAIHGLLGAPLPEAAGSVGLGYGIAIAVGILVLVSTIMLASYVCVRVKGGTHLDSTRPDSTRPESDVPTVVIPGLDRPTIDSYPIFIYGGGSGGGGVDSTCPICLSEYRRGESLRCMPDCKHCFHVRCIDEWLRMSPTCPLCRNSPVPTPVATPLSDVIPLAVHAR